MYFNCLRRPFAKIYNAIIVVVFSSLATVTSASEKAQVLCSTTPDTYIGNAQAKFVMTAWMQRGICIRAKGGDGICYQTLLDVLNNLVELRKAEYGGAAGVLALLPTINAILGAPTNEVWTLLTILPFGGALAMLLSFGGAIMPVRVEDYEQAMRKRNIAIGSITSVVSFRSSNGEADQPDLEDKLSELHSSVLSCMARKKPLRIHRLSLSAGLLGMTLLFIGSQAAMTVVEQGGILPWWCSSRWWMHMWYFMVTLTAAIENLVQLPFSKQHKLYVSRVPYQIELSGGESIVIDPQRTLSDSEKVGESLEQLASKPGARVTFPHGTIYTKSANTVLVMVSVAGSSKFGSVWRLLSKSVSIAVFITGTAMFASVTLVSLPMAVLALTLVLSAGVFGRAIAGWMVRTVAEQEPMIHVIVNHDHEANSAIARILVMQLPDNTHVQVEIDGHIFVDGRRVSKRRRWHLAMFGVLSSPYDLGKLYSERAVTPENGALLPTAHTS